MQTNLKILHLLKEKSSFYFISQDYYRNLGIQVQISFVKENGFFEALCMSLELIESEFVCISENSEIIVYSGLLQAISFLKEHKDFIACSGSIGGFVISSGVFRIYERYRMLATSTMLDQEHIQSRIKQGFFPFTYFGLYGGVIRTDLLKKVVAEVKNINISDEELIKKYILLRMLSLGKMNYMDNFYTKFKCKDELLFFDLRSWPERVLFGDWMKQLEEMISSFIESIECCQVKIDKEFLKNLYFEEKQRFYHTDFFFYVPLSKRIRLTDYWISFIEKKVPFLKNYLSMVHYISFLIKLFFKANYSLARKQQLEIRSLKNSNYEFCG